MQEHTVTGSRIDPRTWMVLCAVGIAAIILIRAQATGAVLYAACLFIHLVTGKASRVARYLVSYFVFLGVTWCGVQFLQNKETLIIGIMLSNIGILVRKATIPLSFAVRLSEEPTGSLMAALLRLRFPKAVGIGLAVLLRFFPTMKAEYRAIRASQRFRGIGVGVFHTLCHLPSTIEYILIPLILRTIKVSEELSASMTVRGVRFSGETISFRPIRFTRRDALICAASLIVSLALWWCERMGVF